MNKGFWIGFIAAGLMLVILQIIYIFRIDWIETAKEVKSKLIIFKINILKLIN